MTNSESPNESRLDRIERLVEANAQQIDKLTNDLESESKKWDERFFQLSRDTLNFSRNVIVTAAVVAVLAPILRDALSAVFEILVNPSR